MAAHLAIEEKLLGRALKGLEQALAARLAEQAEGTAEARRDARQPSVNPGECIRMPDAPVPQRNRSPSRLFPCRLFFGGPPA